MDTKEIIIICLTAIVIAMIIGGAILMTNSNRNIDPTPINQTSVSNNVTADVLSNDTVPASADDDIVSVEVKYNSQAGGGYYKEITYKDGGFRQYDMETGELIGSSYASDQSKLPSME